MNLLLLLLFAQRGEDLLHRETFGSGAAATSATNWLRRRWRSASSGLTGWLEMNVPGALLGSKHAADLELLISADNGVGIDREVDRDLPDSGQPVAGFSVAPAMAPST